MAPRVSPEVCILCKGARRLCGLSYCPLIRSFRANVRSVTGIGSNLEVYGSTPPSVIVGEKGYPRVRLYYGVPPGVRGDRARIYDDPLGWFLRKGLGDIIELRGSLLSIILEASVYNPEKLYEKEIGIAALSIRPVDTEARLERKPVPRIAFDPITPPRGPSAPAKNVRVVGNPVVPRRADRLIWDDLKASDAVWELYSCGVDIYTIIRGFTIGFFGRKQQKKIVPTRWGITAVDSIISNKMLQRVRANPLVNDTTVYYSEYLYNKYLIILYPSRYTASWIEVWHPRSLWNPGAKASWLIVTESYSGRISMMDGGFMAARTSVIEHLFKNRRQAGYIILREVRPQYIFPVGNWQIRETVKHALSKGPITRNPNPNELTDIIRRRMKVPRELIDYIIRVIYARKSRSITEWLK